MFFKVKGQIFVRNHLTVGWEGKERHSLTRMRKENKFGILYLLGIVERENNPETKVVFDVNLQMFSRNKYN